jgi:recombination protein RecT
MGEKLAERVNQRAQAKTTTTAVATRDAEPMTLSQYIRNMESEFGAAMPQGIEAKQLVRDALTALRTQKNLDKCDHLSVLGGLMTCAQLGLRVGVLGHAWLIPFYNSKYEKDAKGEWKGRHQAQLIIGYQGFRELAQRSGQIASVIGRIVHEQDTFEVEYGIADTLIHKPRLDGPRGGPAHYYAVVKYTNGGYSFWNISKAEAEEHRDKHAMAKYFDKALKRHVVIGPWRDDFDAMAVKTAFLKLSKWMPKSTELSAAIAADGTVRVDLTPNADAMLHGVHPDPRDAAPDPGDSVDGEVVSTSDGTGTPAGPGHGNGHGNWHAWSPDCKDCAGDMAGEHHWHEHAERVADCAFCEREAAWRGARS